MYDVEARDKTKSFKVSYATNLGFLSKSLDAQPETLIYLCNRTQNILNACYTHDENKANVVIMK